uniref:Uncharacterized protein n=1 Tax=Cucumis melo TaxID=3656 RepID=A0A9I9EBM2_CUCME
MIFFLHQGEPGVVETTDGRWARIEHKQIQPKCHREDSLDGLVSFSKAKHVFTLLTSEDTDEWLGFPQKTDNQNNTSTIMRLCGGKGTTAFWKAKLYYDCLDLLLFSAVSGWKCTNSLNDHSLKISLILYPSRRLFCNPLYMVGRFSFHFSKKCNEQGDLCLTNYLISCQPKNISHPKIYNRAIRENTNGSSTDSHYKRTSACLKSQNKVSPDFHLTKFPTQSTQNQKLPLNIKQKIKT